MQHTSSDTVEKKIRGKKSKRRECFGIDLALGGDDDDEEVNEIKKV